MHLGNRFRVHSYNTAKICENGFHSHVGDWNDNVRGIEHFGPKGSDGDVFYIFVPRGYQFIA